MNLLFSLQHLEACTYMKKKRWPSGFKGLFLHCSNVLGTTVVLGLDKRRRKVQAGVVHTPISRVTRCPNLTALMTQGDTCSLHLKASCYARDPSHRRKASRNSRVIFPLLLQQDRLDLGYSETWRQRLQRDAPVWQHGSCAGCTPLALDLHRGPRLAPFPCYFKSCHTLLSLHFKFKGQQDTIKHKAIIPGSWQSPAISKQSRVQIIERPISAGYKSRKEGSPEPAHNSQPVGQLPQSLTDRFFPWGQLARKEATTVML